LGQLSLAFEQVSLTNCPLVTQPLAIQGYVAMEQSAISSFSKGGAALGTGESGAASVLLVLEMLRTQKARCALQVESGKGAMQPLPPL
jgi:hypothetical protein